MSIELRNVSRWYGNVVAVNDVTMSIGPGVTGLLGPNGAGKSTLMHMIAGFLPPSRGELTIGTRPSWRNPAIYREIGLVPERDSVYSFLTGEQFVMATAKLHELADPGDAVGPRAGKEDVRWFEVAMHQAVGGAEDVVRILESVQDLQDQACRLGRR